MRITFFMAIRPVFYNTVHLYTFHPAGIWPPSSSTWVCGTWPRYIILIASKFSPPGESRAYVPTIMQNYVLFSCILEFFLNMHIEFFLINYKWTSYILYTTHNYILLYCIIIVYKIKTTNINYNSQTTIDILC